ncbi:MAG TPA: hypothetical protein VGY53_00460 [Isosphaeraceae bacterium]|jgi:hypothetical protein|nr:hypothetical protein [Isosphaeraceae bacterium]
MAIEPYTYQPRCSSPGCDHPARYKVAAEWSDGVYHELKNYGLACEHHRASQLDRALTNRVNLRLAEGETVGPVELYKLVPGKRDSELPRIKQ